MRWVERVASSPYPQDHRAWYVRAAAELRALCCWTYCAPTLHARGTMKLSIPSREKAQNVVLMAFGLGFLAFVGYGFLLIAMEYEDNIAKAFAGTDACARAISRDFGEGVLSRAVVVASSRTRFADHYLQSALVLRSKDLSDTTESTAVCHFGSPSLSGGRIEWLPGNRIPAFELVTRSLLDPRLALARDSAKLVLPSSADANSDVSDKEFGAAWAAQQRNATDIVSWVHSRRAGR